MVADINKIINTIDDTTDGINMDSDIKAKIKAKLTVCAQAVNGMMQPDVDEEEKMGWVAIYNSAMKKVMNDYLKEEEPAPVEEPAPEIPEDIDGITDAPEGA